MTERIETSGPALELSLAATERAAYEALARRAKIDEALRRVSDGSYGYCEETGDPIGVERLEARPIATLTVEAQERHEREERLRREH